MSLPAASTLPAVVAAVYEAALVVKQAGDVEDVLYGPTPQGATMNHRALAVFVGSPGAVSRPDVMQGFDGAVYAERVDVTCNAISWTGASDGASIQRNNDAAFAVIAALKTRIEGDPTLGGVCERATIGQVMSAYPVNDSQGASVEVAFTVTTFAYI